MSGAQDLKGLTVVSVEQAVAAPYASSRLADAGARVNKVERKDGDFARAYDRLVEGQSSYFVWLNRGKQSVCLDLRAEADRALLTNMIAKADIFIQNLRPQAMVGLGFGAAALRARHPRLITCDITGFGTTGPRANLKAYDLIVQGEVGLCDITGDSGPSRVGLSVCDIAAGVTAHAAIMQALYARERTGVGRAIEISLFDSVADWMSVPLLQYIHGGCVPARIGVSHATIAPYGAFACRDGRRIIFSVQNDREWVAFAERFLKRPDLMRDDRFHDNSARVANRPALSEIITRRFAELNETEAIDQLERAGLAWGRLSSIVDASTHPHLRFVTIDTPEGEVRVIAPAPKVDGETPPLGSVPSLGEHGREIREEFAPLAC